MHKSNSDDAYLRQSQPAPGLPGISETTLCSMRHQVPHLLNIEPSIRYKIRVKIPGGNCYNPPIDR
jgi:hypothetical protein